MARKRFCDERRKARQLFKAKHRLFFRKKTHEDSRSRDSELQEE